MASPLAVLLGSLEEAQLAARRHLARPLGLPRLVALPLLALLLAPLRAPPLLARVAPLLARVPPPPPPLRAPLLVRVQPPPLLPHLLARPFLLPQA